MSISTSQLNKHLTNIILKTFVRETAVENLNNTVINDSKLNFDGDEAKIIYEEIINDKNKIKTIDNINDTKNKNKISKVFACNLNNNTKYKSTIYNSHLKTHNIKIDINKILKAVEQGDIEYLKNNLTNDNINIVDNYGWTPLMCAAYCGNSKIVKFLLKLGAYKNYKDKCGFTALRLAKKKNHVDIIHLLKAKELNSMKQMNCLNNLAMKEFHCSICKITFKETSVREHETSTLHIFNTNPKLPDPIYGISTQNRGYQIMVNNGWEESKGLGPSGSGLKYPVKTVLKRDRKGLGHKPKIPARITHFQSGDTAAICHAKQLNINNDIANIMCKRKREKLNNRERRKEIAIRQALS